MPLFESLAGQPLAGIIEGGVDRVLDIILRPADSRQMSDDVAGVIMPRLPRPDRIQRRVEVGLGVGVEVRKEDVAGLTIGRKAM